jgi:hypothetical protein
LSAGCTLGGSTSSPQQQAVINEASVRLFLDYISERTSNCTIKQLEQLYSELAREIFETRHEWNRMTVLDSLTKVFDDTLEDIQNLQHIVASSQEGVLMDVGNDEAYVVLR